MSPRSKSLRQGFNCKSFIWKAISGNGSGEIENLDMEEKEADKRCIIKSVSTVSKWSFILGDPGKQNTYLRIISPSTSHSTMVAGTRPRESKLIPSIFSSGKASKCSKFEVGPACVEMVSAEMTWLELQHCVLQRGRRPEPHPLGISQPSQSKNPNLQKEGHINIWQRIRWQPLFLYLASLFGIFLGMTCYLDDILV